MKTRVLETYLIWDRYDYISLIAYLITNRCVFVKFENILDMKDMRLFQFLEHEHVLLLPFICYMIYYVYMS